VRYCHWVELAIFLTAVSPCSAQTPAPAAGWLPIVEEELKMTSEPKAPGAPAIILYRQVDRDDSTQKPHEYNYVREKIFTEEGRKYADVELPFVDKQEKIHDIKARTIHPDGTIVDFGGTVYEKEIVKARGFKYLAKTFTLSDVQPGSIIEFQYAVEFREGVVFNSHWMLSQELYTERARFSLKRYPFMILQRTWPNGLPEGSTLPTLQGDTIRLESQNIPAFQIEDDMPPPDSLKFKVDFIYGEADPETDPEKFWKNRAMRVNLAVEGFIGKHKAIDEAAARIVSATDSPGEKLQKIYARVQQIRNTSYGAEKTEQEQKREKEKENKNADDVWKRGQGNWAEINWTFVALARAAGLDAYVVMIAMRDGGVFNPKLRRASDLNTNAVLVMLNGMEVYLDPGAAFTPFGLLPAGEIGSMALRVDKDGGKWVTTTTPESLASQIERKADLKLDADGSLGGKLSITYTGLEAALRRYDERAQDEVHRKKFLEDDVKESIPTGAEVELVNKPDWTSTAPTLIADFNVKVPNWISGAGRRVLLPAALFSAAEKHACESATRVHPLYFSFKYQKVDDIWIELPPDWKVDSLPQPRTNDANLAFYGMKVEREKDKLHLQRTLRSELMTLGQEQYQVLRSFYQGVRTGDEEQIVLQAGETAGGN
jgi:hypothetical protein